MGCNRDSVVIMAWEGLQKCGRAEQIVLSGGGVSQGEGGPSCPFNPSCSSQSRSWARCEVIVQRSMLPHPMSSREWGSVSLTF
jgi:hypothetical protein